MGSTPVLKSPTPDHSFPAYISHPSVLRVFLSITYRPLYFPVSATIQRSIWSFTTRRPASRHRLSSAYETGSPHSKSSLTARPTPWSSRPARRVCVRGLRGGTAGALPREAVRAFFPVRGARARRTFVRNGAASIFPRGRTMDGRSARSRCTSRSGRSPLDLSSPCQPFERRPLIPSRLRSMSARRDLTGTPRAQPLLYAAAPVRG